MGRLGAWARDGRHPWRSKARPCGWRDGEGARGEEYDECESFSERRARPVLIVGQNIKGREQGDGRGRGDACQNSVKNQHELIGVAYEQADATVKRLSKSV